MASAPKKGLKIRRALKSAARLPSRVSSGRGSGRNTFSPIAGELPLVHLRLQVLGCTALLAKDRNGYSDPFVVVSVLNIRHQTPVAKRNVNPTYLAKDATFDFSIYLSLADKLGVLELVVWDKDMISKDYLGEAAIPLDEWFTDKDGKPRPFAFDDPGNLPFSVNLLSTRANTHATGTVQIKLGFVVPQNTQHLLDFDEIFSELINRSRPSLVSAPPTEGVGTVRSHQSGPAYEDDGGISSDDPSDDDDDDDEEDPDVTGTPPTPLSGLYLPPPPHSAANDPPYPKPHAYLRPPKLTFRSSSPATLPQEPKPMSAATPILSHSPTSLSSTSSTPTQTPAAKLPSSPSFIPKLFPLPRRISGLGASTSSSQSELATPASSIPPPAPVYNPVVGGMIPGTPAPTPMSEGEGELEVGKEQGTRKRRFKKSWSTGGSSRADSALESGSGSTSGSGSDMTAEKTRQQRKADYSLETDNDIVGIVMLEIQSAEDLPRLKNMTRTGWDMDPFVVISFGKKVFRTRVIRHSRNPIWDEKLLFHVRRYETAFRVQLTILDWDKLSSNDHIGDAGFDITDLLQAAPQPDPATGLYATEEKEGGHKMSEYRLPLGTGKGVPWEAKHNPVINIRAKYQPYDALRQRFWRQYLRQYDTDDTGHISHLELTSMLDSLGSTLTRTTVHAFFTHHGKAPHRDELTFAEAIQCLETELGRPDSEKRRLTEGEDNSENTSISATPVLLLEGGHGEPLALDQLDFSGPALVIHAENGGTAGAGEKPGAVEPTATEPAVQPLADAAVAVAIDTVHVSGDDPRSKVLEAHRQASYLPYSSGDDVEESLSSGSTFSNSNPSALSGNIKGSGDVSSGNSVVKHSRFRRTSGKSKAAKVSMGKEAGAVAAADSHDSFERVINVKNCPLCHRPRLNSKAEMDIVTHLAVCASQDWNKVDRIVVGNFVTASQAQRKWYTRIISKVSSGDYRLGANSANIIVQNRVTGQLEEEKMQVYVRLGIRLLYKGATSRMEGGRARRLLRSLSIKQGLKYDAPESARDIPAFIQFHGLKVEEILDPVDSFKNFNQFFYRKLKPAARPVESPGNPLRLVSAADCRLMTFATVDDATRLWIKGREFTVSRLLGNAYSGQTDQYAGGALAIFRLAPQDYHRFHSPVEGTIGPMTYIPGEYYTVNPQAIRTALDVYGENARKIVPIDSPQFGRVMAVCIGAMMVGSIQTTVLEGEHVHRGQEFGYFAFGGSTIVILFKKGAVKWDEDLVINGQASLETLVRVGMGIGTGFRAIE